MKKTDMERLGIREGEIVKLTGGRTAHAFCLIWDDNYDNQNETNFVYLNDSSKNIPVIKVSDQTYSNLHNFHSGNLVELQKSNAVKADKLTIKPLYEQNDNEKREYSLGWLQDRVLVSRGDRMIVQHEDSKKTPGFFVIDGKPDSQAWFVDRDTSIEISDKFPVDFRKMITEPGNLITVLPLVKQIKGDDFETTIPSIEVYDNCMKIDLYVKDTIVHQENWASGLCAPTIRAWDDLGNKYLLNRFGGRSGGTQFGDAVWVKTDRTNNSELSCILTPTLVKNARELTLSIEQLMWDIRRHPMQMPSRPIKGQTEIVMTPVSGVAEKHAIHGGPWRFTIPLK
jgi:hypothetical protein